MDVTRLSDVEDACLGVEAVIHRLQETGELGNLRNRRIAIKTLNSLIF